MKKFNLVIAISCLLLTAQIAAAKTKIPQCDPDFQHKKAELTAMDYITLAGATALWSPFIILGGIGEGYNQLTMPHTTPKNTIKIASKILFRSKLSGREFNYFLDRASTYTKISILQVPQSYSSKSLWNEPDPTSSHCGMINSQSLPPYDCYCYPAGEYAFSMILGALDPKAPNERAKKKKRYKKPGFSTPELIRSIKVQFTACQLQELEDKNMDQCVQEIIKTNIPKDFRS